MGPAAGHGGQGRAGIPQTGEEDPLSEVEEPAIAEAVAEMALGRSAPADAPAEEKALVAALDAAEPKAKAAVEARGFHRGDGGAGFAARRRSMLSSTR